MLQRVMLCTLLTVIALPAFAAPALSLIHI